jgi:glycosyltransferase involved in cell wall biosynthesis
MTLAHLSPLPPARSGIAHYSAMLLAELARAANVTAVVQDDQLEAAREAVRSAAFPVIGLAEYQRRRGEFDAVVYQLGNNPHHEWIYREAMAHPGVIVLHDLVLHHLIVEMTLAVGDVEGYVEALRANHGQAGAAWARGRAAGLHTELANFLMPASIDVANRSRAVIVHNHYAAERLQSFGIGTPIHVVPHPYQPVTFSAARRDQMRRRFGFMEDHRVVGLFGFLTSAKRGEIALEAFARAYGRDPRLRLLMVGEPAPNIDLNGLVRDRNLASEVITTTGYVTDEDLTGCFAAVDRLINLRYPSAGETSGTLIQAFSAGKPVAVSDYAQFAELPDDCVTKIAFGDGEAAALEAFLLRDLDNEAIAAAQRRWLETNARLDLAVAGYLRAIEGPWEKGPGARAERRGVLRVLPLFPCLSLVRCEATRDGARLCLRLRLRNDGDALLRTRSYGQRGYRLIAKLFDATSEVFDRWVELPRDLAPGDEADVSINVPINVRIDVPGPAPATLRLELYDAMESIPMIDPEPFATEVLTLAAL